MPLIKSGSKQALKKNIETEMRANPSMKDRKQNLAIAYSVMKHNKKKMAKGGMVENEMLYPHHELGKGPQTGISKDSDVYSGLDQFESLDMPSENRMSAEPESMDKPSGMLGMDAQYIVDNLRKMAEGGQVSPTPSPSPTLPGAQAFSDSLKKALHAEGGEIEGLGDDQMNSDFVPDDVLSQDSDPMSEDLSRSSNMIQAQDEDDQNKMKGRMNQIMSELHARHYGKR